MSVFIDSRILLRAVHRTDPHYEGVRSAIRALVGRQVPVFTGLQQFAEFWNVSTRPPGERGGFNLSVDEVDRRLHRIERGVRLLAETTATSEIWRNLVVKHAVKGVQVHDARLVALMLTHSLARLLTLNKADFLRYKSDGIIPQLPGEVVQSTLS